MAPVECPDCKKPISAAALACPHCGRPLPSTAAAEPEVVASLLRGNKIEAIKILREHNPALDLAAAKSEVERIERTLPPGSIPKRGGCGTRAAVVLALLGLAALWFATVPAATIAATDSRIVEVTVYPDRAEVVREARVELPKGASTIELSGIPFGADPDSIRVSARGVPATFGAVEIRARVDEPKESAEQKALEAEVKRLEGEIAKIGVQSGTSNDLREFLKSLRATTSERESENLGAGRADPASIQAVYDLLSTRLGQLGEADLERRAALERFNKELQLARAKLAAAPAPGSMRSRTAQAEVDAAQAGALTLRLAYLVPGAWWQPSYRATLDPKSGEVALVSEGIVRQQTGEDWNGVKLLLSTASPSRGVAPPEMSTWLLRPYEAQAGAKQVENRAIVSGVSAKDSYQNVLVLAPGVADEIETTVDTAPTQAAIVRSAYNVSFEVPGASDVPSDGADHRVVLRQETLPGTLDYRAAPAIQPSAYLTSVVKAPAKYPLLAGPMRVMAGGAYLGTYALPETPAEAELTIPFGVDNRVKLTRVRQPQERGSEGITGKTRQISYEFRTTLENLRDEKVTVTVEDRVPVSEDQRIEVALGKETTSGHRESKHRPGVLLWNVELAARETKRLVLAYTVRHPKDLYVAGLD